MIVIKRNKKEQKYSLNKIRRAVAKAGRDAKLPGKKIKSLASKVGSYVNKKLKGRKTVKSTMIKKLALAKLTRLEKSAAHAWRKYDKRHHKR